MGESARAARGIAASAFASASGFLITFFLTPFVVESLGNARYGTWIVLHTLVSYAALLDLGFRAAVTKYVARDHAIGNHEGSSAAVSATLWVRQWISVLVLCGASLVAWTLEPLLNVQSQLLSEARLALVLMSLAVVVSLVGGVFGGVLQAMNRQDVLATTTFLHTAVRAVGTVVLLQKGYGLVALAVLECAAAILANAILVCRCFRLYPELRLSYAAPSRKAIVELGSYSGAVLLFQVFGHIIHAGPTLVVAAVLSPTAVTFYVIGASLIHVVQQVRMTVTPLFLPLASRYDASGNRAALQALLHRGTTLVLMAVLPVLVGLFFRGETFIAVWMGPEYSGTSGQIMRVLAIAAAIVSATATEAQVMFGLGRHRDCVVWPGIQAAATLVLSVALAKTFGLAGVAWAVAIPVVLRGGVTWMACRLVGVSVTTHLLRSWGRPAVAVAPFAVACAVTNSYWEAQSVPELMLQVAAIFPIYVVSCGIFLRADLRHGWSAVRGRRPTSKAAAAATS